MSDVGILRLDPAGPVDDGKKAAAFMAGVPADQVEGFILVTYLTEGEPRVDASVCCYAHIMSLLSVMVADMAAEVAAHAEGQAAV